MNQPKFEEKSPESRVTRQTTATKWRAVIGQPKSISMRAAIFEQEEFRGHHTELVIGCRGGHRLHGASPPDGGVQHPAPHHPTVRRAARAVFLRRGRGQ